MNNTVREMMVNKHWMCFHVTLLALAPVTPSHIDRILKIHCTDITKPFMKFTYQLSKSFKSSWQQIQGPQYHSCQNLFNGKVLVPWSFSSSQRWHINTPESRGEQEFWRDSPCEWKMASDTHLASPVISYIGVEDGGWSGGTVQGRWESRGFWWNELV